MRPLSYCSVVPFAALAATLCLVPASASAQSGEACDFVTNPFPSYEQVLECYNSVPWCADPSDPLTCDRDNQAEVFEEVLDSFSTVKGFVNAQADYRNKLAAIRSASFAGDYDQFKAFQDLLIDFRNGHWVYLGPICYTRQILPYLPLNFGSMLAKTSLRGESEQIIYLEAPVNGVGTADNYFAQTGIDLNQFEGMRVVSIDGVPAIDYLRNFSDVVRPSDGDAGNGLMEVLEFNTWSFRGGAFGIFPEAPVVEFVFADRLGRKEKVVLPWVFQTYFDLGLDAPPPTATNAEFADLCFTPGAGFTPAAEEGEAPDLSVMRNTNDVRALLKQTRDPAQRVAIAPDRVATKNAMKLLAGTGPSGRQDRSFAWGDFVEVPESKRNVDIVEILPLTDGARILQYADNTVAIQLGDFVGPWVEEVEFGVDFACQNADRLVVDLRNNGGGLVGQVEWLTDYLYPQGSAANNRFVFRDLANSPRLNELRVKAQENRELSSPSEPLEPAWNSGQSIAIDPSRGTLLMSAVDEPTWLAPLPGYGNNWLQSAGWTVSVPDDPNAQISGEWYYDVEPDFDFVFVDVIDASGTSTPIAVFTGFTSADGFLDFVPFAFDVGQFAGQDVTLLLTVQSDGLFSDQDGLYDSFGPLAIDFIEVSDGVREDFDGEAVPPNLEFSAEFVPLASGCALSGYEFGCLADFDTLEPFTDPEWYVEPTVVEQRGTDNTVLTQLAALNDRNNFPFNSTPCPGKFEGKNLIVLGNGLNASAGFFGPVALDPIATTVTAGGYPKIEEMFLGQARGGNIRDTPSYVSEQDSLGTLLFLNGGNSVFEFPIPVATRDVLFTIEELGTYFADLKTQTSIRDPKTVADLQIPFWSNSEETDGAAYRAVVSAVERDAIIDPVCGDYERYRTCIGYGVCAKIATKKAIKDGLTSEKDAKRARDDAIRDCVLRR
ncbi:MAG: hypothetical protein AAFZ38_07785 [Myxococcota bacterium]